MAAITEVEHAVCVGGAQGDIFAGEGLAGSDVATFEADGAIALDFTNMGMRFIVWRRDLAWHRAGAGPIARRRGRKTKGLMRSAGVVNVPPVIERLLCLGQSIEDAPVEHLAFECPVEALVLTLRLRVVRAAMDDGHADIHQPDSEDRIPLAASRRPPGRAPFDCLQRQALRTGLSARIRCGKPLRSNSFSRCA